MAQWDGSGEGCSPEQQHALYSRFGPAVRQALSSQTETALCLETRGHQARDQRQRINGSRVLTAWDSSYGAFVHDRLKSPK